MNFRTPVRQEKAVLNLSNQLYITTLQEGRELLGNEVCLIGQINSRPPLCKKRDVPGRGREGGGSFQKDKGSCLVDFAIAVKRMRRKSMDMKLPNYASG